MTTESIFSAGMIVNYNAIVGAGDKRREQAFKATVIKVLPRAGEADISYVNLKGETVEKRVSLEKLSRRRGRQPGAAVVTSKPATSKPATSKPATRTDNGDDVDVRDLLAAMLEQMQAQSDILSQIVEIIGGDGEEGEGEDDGETDADEVEAEEEEVEVEEEVEQPVRRRPMSRL